MLRCEPLEERRLLVTLEGTITLPPIFPEVPPPPTAEELVGPVLLGWSVPGDNNSIFYDANLHIRPASLTAFFSGTLEFAAPDGSHSASNPANWQMLLGGVDVSDQIVAIAAHHSSLAADPPMTWVTISFSAPLAGGAYRLIAQDAIHANDGRLLNGDGNLTAGGDAIIDFQVSPFRATTRENIVGGGVDTPVIATDGQGNSVVASIASVRDSTGQLLQVERFNAQNVKVGSAFVLGHIRSDQRYSGVRVSMAADGSFAVAWQTTNPLVAVNGELPSVASVQRFSADGTPLGEPFAPDLNRSWITDLSLAEDGSLVVVSTQDRHWSFISPAEQDPELGPTVYVSRFDAAGQAIGQPTRLGLGDSGQVARRSDGSFVVVWSDGSRPSRGILAQSFVASGEPDGPAVAVSSRSGKSSSPVVAMDPRGNTIIAWLNSQGDARRILLQRLNPAGKWLGPESVVSTDEKPVDGPRLAIGADGRFFIGWAVQTDSFSPVRIRAFDPAATSRETLLVVGDGRAQPTTPALAVDDSGAVIAIWRGARYIDQDARTGEIKFFGDPNSHIRHFEVLDWNASVDLNGERQGTDYREIYVPGGSAAPIADPEGARVLSRALEGPLTLTIQVENPLPGDVLEAESVDGWQYDYAAFAGTFEADGLAGIEHVLRSARFRGAADRPAGSNVKIRFVLTNGEENGTFPIGPSYTTISVHQPGTARIAARHLFYNNSKFDGRDPASNAADDAALATDKSALLPGQSATSANFTSYTAGINGIMVDLTGTHGALTADDFVFRIGTSNDPTDWSYAPVPQLVQVRHNQGAGGSDRIEIIWQDGAIQNGWLQVTVLANGNTGLAQPDVFYFGNRLGDTGNEPARARPQTSDALKIINRLIAAGGAISATVIDLGDFNRDGRITTADLLTVFNAIRAQGPVLEMLTAPSGVASLGGMLAEPLTRFALLEAAVPLDSAGPLAAVFETWSDEDASDASLTVVNAALLMEEPDEN